jgi:hypothetical protein
MTLGNIIFFLLPIQAAVGVIVEWGRSGYYFLLLIFSRLYRVL